MSAAFSAIMMVGALVLPPISVGMTEASTTSQALEPAHLERGIDDGLRIVGRAHAAGADGMIDGVGALADPVGRGLHRRAHRSHRAPSGASARNGGAVMMRRAELHAFEQQLQVAGVAEERRIDARRAHGIGIGEADAAAALGPQHADVQAVAGAEVPLAAVIVDQAEHEVQLDVGPRQRRIGLQEAAGLGEVGGEQPAPLAPPAQDLARQPRQARRREAEQVRARRPCRSA